PVTAPQHEIVCYSRDARKEFAKPTALIALEKERASSFEKEYSLIHPQSLHSNSPLTSVAEEEKDEDDLDTTIILPKQTPPRDATILGGSVSTGSAMHAEKSGPFYDVESIVQENSEFLTGKQCLYGGGTGWWKYEFCYGKRVVQYHDDPQNGRTEIVLGIFSEEIHKQWMRENPQKHPLKASSPHLFASIDGQVLLASHIYTGGDICEEENIHRSVEVRIRCRPSEGSQSAVTLFLLEPHTCQYVLGVESPRFCDMLQSVDEYGLLPIPKT
ncbi:unnamed protein product, partial [Toxocara canis]|uniref:Endoplasmic reticulum lectin 1 n=1 Tax=Toxocara canis TaxID=6265 RepID=A0A183VET8_TOXCA